MAVDDKRSRNQGGYPHRRWRVQDQPDSHLARWDPAKHEKTRRERGFGFDHAARIFLGRTVESVDRRRNYR